MKTIKLKTILYWAIVIAVAVSYVLYLNQGWSTTVASSSRIMDACVKTAVLFILASAFSRILTFLLKNSGGTSKKGQTVAKLVASMVKYAVALIAIIIALGYFIEDTTALITGVSMLTLVIGLGTTSLITDIVAGIFIVFEGDYQVGDVVVIDGWRGKVNEIGIRTTKIEDIGGNIQIINNSNISKIINNSATTSFAMCTVGIEYSESLERVENVIAKLLPKIADKYPSVVEGPFYRGVDSLGDSSVNLLIVAKCAEEDKFQLQRDLNREVKLAFDKNDIGIPFPQVTVSQLKEDKAEASAFQKFKAEKFVEKQRGTSGEDENNN